MPASTQPASRRAHRLLAAGLGLALLTATGACGGGAALGLTSPPPSLDPASPRLSANNLAFDKETFAVPADERFVLVFENREALQHNVSIYADVGLRQRRFEGVLFGGPATRWYPVPALAAGTYVFVCDLHPNMRGLLEAG